MKAKCEHIVSNTIKRIPISIDKAVPFRKFERLIRSFPLECEAKLLFQCQIPRFGNQEDLLH